MCLYRLTQPNHCPVHLLSSLLHDALPARHAGNVPKGGRGDRSRGYPGGELSPEISNDVVFGIFSPENAKNDVVRNEGGNRAREFLTTSLETKPQKATQAGSSPGIIRGYLCISQVRNYSHHWSHYAPLIYPL